MRADKKGTGVTVPGLYAYRERALLTQQGLAEKARISRKTISDAEQGARISRNNARKLAEALSIEAALLLQPAGEAERVPAHS